jgi:hypothetical protein
VYTIDIVNSRSGVKLTPSVDPESGTWSRVLCAGGKGQHVFALPDDDVMWDKDLSTPWSRTLVVSWDGVAIYAGIIVDRTFDDVAGTLTIQHEDFRSLLQRRYPFGVKGYTQDGTTATGAGWLTLTGLSQRAIIIRLLQEALTGPFAIYSMPVIVNGVAIAVSPLATEAGGFTRTYENHEFLTADRAIANVQDEDGGPDVDFEPLWVGAVFRWNLRIGSPTAPRLSEPGPGGVPFEFNMAAEEQPLTGMKVRESGLNQVTGIYAVGKGMGRDMKVAGNGFGDSATIPALDVVESYKEEIDYNRLFSYANSALPIRGKTTQQFEFGMLATEDPGLGMLRMGALFLLIFNAHRWIGDGHVPLRLVSMSGDMTETLTIDVQSWES